MISVELDGPTVARTRVALSPLADAVCWLRLCAVGKRDGVFGDPGAVARSALAHRDVALVAALLPEGGSGYVPDFLTPKPADADQPLARQLHDVATTSAAVVYQQVVMERFAAGAVPRPISTALGDGSLAGRIASGLALFWQEAVGEAWREQHRILEADVMHRSITAGRDGVGAMLASLDPRVGFSGATLQVNLGAWQEQHSFIDADLVVCPTLFGWPAVSAQLCRSDQAVLCYPASGIGNHRHPPQQASFATLLGGTRSALLGDLDLPRSTRDLSERHTMSAATVSYHLKILYDNGLLTRTRDRHHVLYVRTPRADLLLKP